MNRVPVFLAFASLVAGLLLGTFAQTVLAIPEAKADSGSDARAYLNRLIRAEEAQTQKLGDIARALNEISRKMK